MTRAQGGQAEKFPNFEPKIIRRCINSPWQTVVRSKPIVSIGCPKPMDGAKQPVHVLVDRKKMINLPAILRTKSVFLFLTVSRRNLSWKMKNGKNKRMDVDVDLSTTRQTGSGPESPEHDVR